MFRDELLANISKAEGLFMTESSKVAENRELLVTAQSRGFGATLAAYTRLSGPGWLQSAITLGGGSLAGSLFLGVLGGTKLLWLQLMAITMGVIMLSAISYVTLSTGKKPFQQINTHINPVLGWGWIIATMMANIIWCMPQFSLCYAALRENLVGESLGDDLSRKLTISAVILIATFSVVLMNRKQGTGAKVFDLLLKALVGMIVLCFFGVVIYLSTSGQLNWGEILSGFIPDLNQVTNPTGDVVGLIATLPESLQVFWSERIVREQRAVMIGAAATAVGINMTFLLPYSMLNRGWDKPFRGMARFDLCTGMAIPYVIVTSCVVIAASASFHAKVDEAFLSDEPATFVTSPLFGGAQKSLAARVAMDVSGEASTAELTDAQLTSLAAVKTHLGDDGYAALAGEKSDAQVWALLTAQAALPETEKKIVSSLVQRTAFQLSKSLAPLLGENNANFVFGLGIFGMGFSTIIILMLINGFAFCELLGVEQGSWGFTVGCLIAGVAGAIWPLVWDGPAKLWLAILASSFGAMLLPIAYFTFFMMMNNRSIMGDNKPKGLSMLIWNVLMAVSVIGALAAAITAIMDKAGDPKAGWLVISISIIYLVLVAIGFALKKKAPAAEAV